MSHRNLGFELCADEGRWRGYFLFSAPWHLSHIFLPSNPSSKSILWYKICHHLTHSTEIKQLPAVILPEKCPASCARPGLVGRGLACLKTLHHNPHSALHPLSSLGAARVSRLLLLECQLLYFQAIHTDLLCLRPCTPPLSSSPENTI